MYIRIFLIWCLSCVLLQIKYAGSDTDFSSSPAFCKQIRKLESEEQRVIGTQTPLPELLEGLIADKELPAKDKKKRLKQVNVLSALCLRGSRCLQMRMTAFWMCRPFQFQRSYPEVYQQRFPTEESKAAAVPEKTFRFKPPLKLFNFKKPLQPFQRSWSFRAWRATTYSQTGALRHYCGCKLSTAQINLWYWVLISSTVCSAGKPR